MRVVTCVSFGGTGSSVVTDLLKEFDNIKSLGEFEFTFIHEKDGILDLKNGVVNNFNRVNNDEVIYRFKKLMRKLNKDYSKYITVEFEKITEEYIKNLVTLTWEGYSAMQEERVTKLKKRLLYRLPDKIQRLKKKIIKDNSDYEFVTQYIKSEINISYMDEDEFNKKTKAYINKLIENMKLEEKIEYVAIDQLASYTQLKEYNNFFDDIKIIIVDRDPRDLYLLNKLYWKEGWIPSDNVELYIKWFKLIRKPLEKEMLTNNILSLKFEDFIYNYESTIEKMISFLEIDKKSHKNKYKYFNPNISIKNTKLYEKDVKYKRDIEKIKGNLQEYCYEI